MRRSSPPLLVPPPAGRARRRANLFIAAFVLLQVLVPLRYYVAGDPFDERFAWRMFSSLGQHSCQFALFETVGGDTQPVSLQSQLTAHWIRKLDQYQPRVVRAVLRSRCAQVGVSTVRYERRCAALDGSPLPAEHLSIACDRARFAKDPS